MRKIKQILFEILASEDCNIDLSDVVQKVKLNLFSLCSMLLHLFVPPLQYNAEAARGLLGRTDKNIICHFLATEVVVYFCNNKRLL